jgi:hypothetical protein
MAQRAEVSIGMGLAVAGVVFAVYSNVTPNMADIRAAEPGNADVDGTRKLAAWTSAGVVGGISLIAKDPTIFIIGGAMVIAMDWFHRHSNEVDPRTGKAAVMPEVDASMADMGASDDQADVYAMG